MSKFIFTGFLILLLGGFLNYPASNDDTSTNTVHKETIIFPISEQIKIAREEKQMSVKELATRVNITKATLERLEKGQITPSQDILLRLEQALDVKLNNQGY